MALSHYVTYASGTTGTQTSLNMDPSITPWNGTVQVYVVGGSASYSVQWSLDDYATVSDANARWVTDPQFPLGSAATINANLLYPVTRIRLVIVTNTGGIELKTLQGFTTN